LSVDRQPKLPIRYESLVLDVGYRIDLLVERRIFVEVKSVDQIADVHRAQLLSYLRLGGFHLGYLLNFNVVRMKEGIVRLLNGYEREAL
jgi:GxxExxY protein